MMLSALDEWKKKETKRIKVDHDCIPFFCFPLVTDVELKRLKDAFKRTSGPTYYMTQQCFYREVLGDGVPHKVAEVSHIIHYVPLTTNTALVHSDIN